MSLYTKMVQIMGEIPGLHKDKEMRGTYSYAYVSDVNVYTAVRALLIKYGVALFAAMTDARQEQYTVDGKIRFHTLAQFTFTLVDSETGETMSCQWYGESNDAGDKGINKAATTGLKYWLLKTFIVPTGDDADDFASEERAALPPVTPDIWKNVSDDAKSKTPLELLQEDYDLGLYVWGPLQKTAGISGTEALHMLGLTDQLEWDDDLRSLLIAVAQAVNAIR